jgi:hypothetical protein
MISYSDSWNEFRPYLAPKSSQWKSTIDTKKKSPITFSKSVDEGFSEIEYPNYHYTVVKTHIQPLEVSAASGRSNF